MKTLILSLTLSTLVACGSTIPDPTPCPTTDAAPPPPASDAGLDGSDGSAPGLPCPLRVDNIAPSMVFYGQAHNTVVTAKGCGFLGVADVQVNVTSVAFKAIDDYTLVFLASRDPIEGPDLPLGEVDIIRKQPDQVQTFITYTK